MAANASTPDLAQLVGAYGATGRHPGGRTVAALAAGTRVLARGLRPHELVDAAKAFAAMRPPQADALVAALDAAAPARAEKLAPTQAASLIAALADLRCGVGAAEESDAARFAPLASLPALCERIRGNESDLGAPALAALAVALERLRHRDAPLLSSLAAELELGVAQLDGTELCAAPAAFARLGLTDGAAASLAAAAARELGSRAAAASTGDMAADATRCADLCWALAVFGLWQDSAMKRSWRACIMASLGCIGSLPRATLTQLLDVSELAMAQLPLEKARTFALSGALDDAAQAARTLLDGGASEASAIAGASVTAALQRLGYVASAGAAVGRGGGCVDASVASLKLAILCEGAASFAVSGDVSAPLGSALVRRRLVSACAPGWTVRTFDVRAWTRLLGDEAAQEAFVCEKCADVGIEPRTDSCR